MYQYTHTPVSINIKYYPRTCLLSAEKYHKNWTNKTLTWEFRVCPSVRALCSWRSVRSAGYRSVRTARPCLEPCCPTPPALPAVSPPPSPVAPVAGWTPAGTAGVPVVQYSRGSSSAAHATSPALVACFEVCLLSPATEKNGLVLGLYTNFWALSYMIKHIRSNSNVYIWFWGNLRAFFLLKNLTYKSCGFSWSLIILQFALSLRHYIWNSGKQKQSFQSNVYSHYGEDEDLLIFYSKCYWLVNF